MGDLTCLCDQCYAFNEPGITNPYQVFCICLMALNNSLIGEGLRLGVPVPKGVRNVENTLIYFYLSVIQSYA